MNKCVDAECSKNKYLDLTKKITSADLRATADKMDDQNVKFFKYTNFYAYGITCIENRPETREEIDARTKKEQAKKLAAYKKIEKEKKALIAKAEKLGLTLVESN